MISPTVPVFGPATLDRILPVAQRNSASDVALTITSLESYSTGFLINVRLDWTGPIGPLPGLTWTATDDRGGTYRCFGSGGSGGGGRPDDYPADARPHRGAYSVTSARGSIHKRPRSGSIPT